MKTVAHIMMLLALGAVISLSGIPACKKEGEPNVFTKRNYQSPMNQEQNFSAGNHTPIPGSILLFGSGVAAMAWLGWRKRSKR